MIGADQFVGPPTREQLTRMSPALRKLAELLARRALAELRAKAARLAC